jgi:hypothetical protein
MASRRTLRRKTWEQRELEHYRDHDTRPCVRERCSALLRIAAGETPHAVARLVRHGLGQQGTGLIRHAIRPQGCLLPQPLCHLCATTTRK